MTHLLQRRAYAAACLRGISTGVQNSRDPSTQMSAR